MLVTVDSYPGISVRAPEGAPTGVINHGMTAGTPPSFTTSHYTGPMIELAMACPDADYTRADVELAAFSESNTLGSGFKLPLDQGGATVPASDSMLIECGDAPTPVPGADATATASPDLPETGSGGDVGLDNDGTDDGTDGAGLPDDDDGSSNTGLWIAIGALVAAAAALGTGAFAWRRTHQ